MAERPGCLLIVTAEVAPDVEAEGGGTTERSAKRIYTTIYELDSPGAVATPEFQTMRGWYQFAPHVRSRPQVSGAAPRLSRAPGDGAPARR